MEHPVHDLPVTGLSFTQGTAGATLGGYDLVASSADYKITFFKSQGETRVLSFLLARTNSVGVLSEAGISIGQSATCRACMSEC